MIFYLDSGFKFVNEFSYSALIGLGVTYALGMVELVLEFYGTPNTYENLDFITNTVIQITHAITITTWMGSAKPATVPTSVLIDFGFTARTDFAFATAFNAKFSNFF
jgi:hypothetical protein